MGTRTLSFQLRVVLPYRKLEMALISDSGSESRSCVILYFARVNISSNECHVLMLVHRLTLSWCTVVVVASFICVYVIKLA